MTAVRVSDEYMESPMMGPPTDEGMTVVCMHTLAKRQIEIHANSGYDLVGLVSLEHLVEETHAPEVPPG